MRDAGRIARWTIALLVATALQSPGCGGGHQAAARSRSCRSTRARSIAEQRWIGEGVAEIISLGLAQHPAFVAVDEARVRAGQAAVWNEAAVGQAARTLRADDAVFGQIVKSGADLVIQPRLLEVKGTGFEVVALEPITVPEGELLARLVPLPATYARTLKVPLTDAETRRMDKAAQPTRSLKAFELYARAQEAVNTRPGQEGNEAGGRSAGARDRGRPQLRRRPVHAGQRAPGARQSLEGGGAVPRLDPARSDLSGAVQGAGRPVPGRAAPAVRSGDRGVHKAIELRPFYADAYVGLGEARAAKGEVDGAIGAYTKALAANPINPRVHMSLGKIYYAEKGLYYESVTAYRRRSSSTRARSRRAWGWARSTRTRGSTRKRWRSTRRSSSWTASTPAPCTTWPWCTRRSTPRKPSAQWERYIALAAQLPSEKDWVDVARQHLRKLKSQVKE